MNLLLLEPHHFLNDDTIVLCERQRTHVLSIIKPKVGDTLSVGQLNGMIGTAKICEINTSHVKLNAIEWTRMPPKARPITLILAMPRPQMLKRILQTIATMGVSKLGLIQTQRGEKSFWQSPSATDESIRQHLILGLEQGKATQLPIIEKYRNFHSFTLNALPNLSSGSIKYIAHPGDHPYFSPAPHERTLTLAIGPEGGFIDQEIAIFNEQGFETRQLGERILKVETAVTALLAKLY